MGLRHKPNQEKQRQQHQPNQTKPPLLTVIIGTMEHSRSTSIRSRRLPQQPENDYTGHRSRRPWFLLFEGRIFGVVSVVFVVIAAAVVIVNFGGDRSGKNADATAGVLVEALSTPSSNAVSSEYVTTELMPSFLIPPRKTRNDGQITSNMTLREFLTHPDGFHLGMAPSFFGFYGM